MPPAMPVKKIPIHWNRIKTATSGSVIALRISFITFLIMLSSNDGRIARRECDHIRDLAIQCLADPRQRIHTDILFFAHIGDHVRSQSGFLTELLL